MKFAQKVAIAVNLAVEAKEEYISLKELNFLNECEIHFVNAFQTTTYSFGLGESALIYPVADDRKKLEESIVASLRQISNQIFGEGFRGKIHCHCLFSDNPKVAFSEFVHNKNIDLVVVSAREKRGLFESSFSQYVQRHTKSNVLILKQKSAGN